MEAAVPRFADAQSAFIASVILGEYYATVESLPIVERLAASTTGRARLYMPHALGHLYIRSTLQAERLRIIACLESLRHDHVDEVRREAEAAVVAIGG
jgi:hypothetical protein